MQLDHPNIYVGDVTKSRAFYGALLPPHGYLLNRDFGEVAVGFGDKDYAVLALVRQNEPVQPMHLAFRVDTRGEVDDLYAREMLAGATDNGVPGLRPHYHEHYYAAFLRDPDGHNLEFVCHKSDG
ncbi:MAG: VOC family protein [Proteobacteria bacterium]|jgi:catechol 2,3-dioxygenase-like lactoylglutathione lyase family enzyme|nr:VOC family protein [Pseudomonadota bacterium]